MKTLIRSTLAVLAVTFAASSASYGAFVAPEIDPAMGTGALALLGGAIMVLRGRRRK